MVKMNDTSDRLSSLLVEVDQIVKKNYLIAVINLVYFDAEW